MKTKLLFLAFALFTLCGYAQNDPKIIPAGTPKTGTIYKGVLGADGALIVPAGTHDSIYQDLSMTRRVQYNAGSDKFEGHGATGWQEFGVDKAVLDTVASLAEQMPTTVKATGKTYQDIEGYVNFLGDISGFGNAMFPTATFNNAVVTTVPNGETAITNRKFVQDIANAKADLVGGKVPLSQINDALIGAVNYQGTYNASTNVPALPAASSNKGKYWVVNIAGTQQGENFKIGDWVISNGVSWGRVPKATDVDLTPTAGSNNAVSSGGVKTALDAKANEADALHKAGNEAKVGNLSITGLLSSISDVNNSAVALDSYSYSLPNLQGVNSNLDIAKDLTLQRSGGNVGIGITPGATLDVGGSFAARGISYHYDQLQFLKAGESVQWAAKIDNATNLRFTNDYFTTIPVLTLGATNMVGINSGTPNHTLDVAGTGHFTDFLQLDIDKSLRFSDKFQWTYRSDYAGLALGVDNVSASALFVKLSNGNFGLNTNDPQAKMHVQGGDNMTAGWNRTAMLSASYPSLVFKSAGSGTDKFASVAYDGNPSAGLAVFVNGSTNDVTGTGVNSVIFRNSGVTQFNYQVKAPQAVNNDEVVNLGQVDTKLNSKVSWADTGNFALVVGDTAYQGNKSFSSPITIAPGSSDSHAATVGQVKAARPYKSYVAYISQAGTNAPTADFVLENSIATFTMTRASTGTYHLQIPGGFVQNKTYYIMNKSEGSGEAETRTVCTWNSINGAIQIATKNSSNVLADGILSGLIEIRVYN